MLKLSTYILFFLSCISIYAQNEKWASETITLEDGLRSDAVTAIIKDHQGFMWFGTALGLHRFDGYQLRTYQYKVVGTPSLSSNMVNDLCKDHNGDLWIAVANGLNKLELETDQIMHYIHDPNDSTSISKGEVKRVFEDSEGTIWAGTTHDLNQFNQATESFVKYTHDANNPNSISEGEIMCMYEDKESAMWISNYWKGLSKMDKSTGMFQHYLLNPLDSMSLKNFVYCVYEDNATNLWVGTGDGLYIFNRKDHTFSRELHESIHPKSPKIQLFAAINEDFEGNYWIRTYGGIYRYSADLKWLNAWEHAPYNYTYFAFYNIKYLHPDPGGIMWYNTHWKGIEKLTPKNKKFRFYQNNPSLEKRGVKSVLAENQKIIWMGTYHGLSRLDRKKNEYQLLQRNPEDFFAICHNSITTILRDFKGNLWFGTLGGLNRLELSDNNAYRFIPYKHDPDDPASIAGTGVDNIFEDPGGSLFVSTSNEGVDIFDWEKESFLHMEYTTGDQKQNRFGRIILVENDRIWTSSYEGVCEIIRPLRPSGLHTVTPDTVIYHKSEFGNPGSLNVNIVYCMYRDRSGNYWLGTGGGGLNKMIVNRDQDSGTNRYQFEHYTKKHGLCNDNVNAILEDEKGRLWIGTENGLSRFDLETETFTNYDRTDGLMSRLFGENAYQAPDGEMFFPSDDGLISFYPDSIEDNPIIPPVVITDLKIFNETIPVGRKSPLKTSISYSKEINLPYNQNFLSIEYAALNYVYPEKNRYKYKMEGLDPDWIEPGTRRHADYPDLKPGAYTFRVLGSNNNGIWNTKGAALNIIINPPWWATYYAYTGYALAMVLIIYGYVRWKTWQIRRERDALEKQVSQRTQQIEEHREEIESQKELLEDQNRKILEMDKMKTKFFNNVSHEFRTPLTLIQGPVEDLQAHAKLSKKEHGKLNMISRNARRLLDLVNQLLDIAKLESGTMKLKLIDDDILQHFRICTGSFSSMAESRGIVYNRLIPRDIYITWFDPGTLEKIVVNLLSNAFKLTPEAGEITFEAKLIHSANHEPTMIEFSVSDQGPGISDNDRDKIFTRFYQIDNDKTQTSTGTGIGLSLVRDLVELNHGEINVQSDLGKGSVFMVKMPLGKAHLKEGEFILSKEKEEAPGFISENIEPLQALIEPAHESQHHKKEERPIILIVEDNADIRRHISDNLDRDYQIVEAVNGQAGLKKALEVIPDLIISDLIMPVMDGIELCRNIKSDECSSHIPIIMLTAKSSLEERLEGLETGADDYLSKPFHMKELKTRIANLIDQRRKLRERFSIEITLEPQEISITSLDEDFLNRAIETVEKHMSDEAFSLNDFQDAMHMSHSTVFRKLYALTNQSPSEFIRNLRLKRAAQLLKEHFGNVAKVSYEVGFNNPSYFSKCFKSLFGVSPVEYSKKMSIL